MQLFVLFFSCLICSLHSESVYISLKVKAQVLYKIAFLSPKHPANAGKIINRCMASLRGDFAVKQTFVLR